MNHPLKKMESSSNLMEAPSYHISLNESPNIRWNHIIPKYANSIKQINYEFFEKISSNFLQELCPFMETNLISLMHQDYLQELKGISSILSIPYYQILALQLAIDVEYAGGCTTIVGPIESTHDLKKSKSTKKTNTKENNDKFIFDNSIPFMIRTLDWPYFLTLLRQLTIQVIFFYDSKPIFQCSTIAGFNGVLTGMNQNLSVSLNCRSPNNQKQNLSFNDRCCWPAGYLIRHVLEKQYSYQHSINCLSQSPLLSPSYLIVCGIQISKSIIITRDQNKSHIISLSSSDCYHHHLSSCLPYCSHYLIMCNMDHESQEDVQDSIARHQLCCQTLCHHQAASLSTLFYLMQKFPIKDPDYTVSLSLMIPSVQRFNTFIYSFKKPKK